MTDLQAAVLYASVQAAKTQGMRVPSSVALAGLLPSSRRIGGRAMSNHLKRLHEAHACFIKRGRSWYIDTAKLVTEPESAAYLLALVVACAQTLKISKTQFHDDLIASKAFDAKTLASIYTTSIASEYIDETNPPGFIRPGHRTADQLSYLKILAADMEAGRARLDVQEGRSSDA